MRNKKNGLGKYLAFIFLQGLTSFWIIFSLFLLIPGSAQATGTNTITAVASNQNLNPGGTFTISLNFNAASAIYGIKVDVDFDPTQVQLAKSGTSNYTTTATVIEGNTLQDYATAHSGSTVQSVGTKNPQTGVKPTGQYDDSGNLLDAHKGEISLGYSMMNLSGAPGFTGSGTACTLNFIVQSGASGTANITLNNLAFVDPSAARITGITPTNTSVTIGSSTQSPTISNFTPVSAAAGATVTIYGTNLSGATAVSFGGTAAASFSVVSATQITAVVSSGSSGNVNVTTSGGNATLAGFTYNGTSSAPTISNFTPVSAGAGGTVTIYGTNLSGATAVSFGGTAAASFSVVSATQITAVVGSGSSGNVNVTTSGGNATLPGFTYNGTSSSPTISIFTPVSAGAGTTVTIYGTNLSGATAVSFGGTAAASFSVVSATQITAVVGNGSSGNVDITTSGGTATLAGFTINISVPTPSPTPSPTPTPTPTPTPPPVSTQTPTPVPSPSSNPILITTVSLSPTPTASVANLSSNVSKITPVLTKPVTSVQKPRNGGLDFSDIINTAGVLQNDYAQNYTVTGNVGIASIGIKSGTRIIDADGNPLTAIGIQPAGNITIPQDTNLISAVEFTPSGTTFSMPMTVVYQYDPSQFPKGTDENDLVFVTFDSTTGKWVEGDYSLNTTTHRITTRLSHFSLYAIVSPVKAGLAGMGWSAAGLIIGLEIAIGLVVIYLFLRRKQPSLVEATFNAPSRGLPQQNQFFEQNNATTRNNVSQQTVSQPQNIESQQNVLPTEVVQEQIQHHVQSLQEPPLRSTAGEANIPPPVQRGIPISAPDVRTTPNLKVELDEILQGATRRPEQTSKVQLAVSGNITIPGSGAAPDIKIVSDVNVHLLITLEYDSEHPLGVTKILAINKSELEKAKEKNK